MSDCIFTGKTCDSLDYNVIRGSFLEFLESDDTECGEQVTPR